MALEDEVNQMFLILMGMLVMFMQCGFAFYEAGSVRSKNTTNILIKNVLDSFISGICYWLFGYAFAYGEGNDFIGYSNFALTELEPNGYANWFFQYSFAAATATIVSGSVAERCDFMAYLAYSAVITGFIYPVATHWQWGGGFLVKGVDYGGDIGRVGYTDFAGSGVVHMLGGAAGFVGALMLGPRIGRFDPVTKKPQKIRGHSIPIAALGGFILLFGFLAFNGGSLASLIGEGDGATISRVIVNTIIGGSFGAFSAMFINKSRKFGNGCWSLLVSMNGALTGMVATCAGVDALYPWGACLLGLLAGPVYHLTTYCVQRVRVDDPLEAVSVHFGGGVLGVLGAGFLHQQQGVFFNWNRRSGMVLLWQLAGMSTLLAWTVVTSLILFGTLRLLKILRVSEDDEIKGLDIIKHKEPAYPVEAYGHGHVEKLISVLSEMDKMKLKQVINRIRGNLDVGIKQLEDTGPYENPEVKAQYHVLNSEMNSNNKTTRF